MNILDSDIGKIILAVLSSTVVNSVINIWWNNRIRTQEIARTKKEEERKAGHVYLIVVDHLEKFARECHERIEEIYDGLAEYRQRHETDRLHRLPEIKFAFDPSLNWQALPISFVAELKSLALRFEECNLWIRAEWNIGVDWDVAYEFEQERLAYYSMKVCGIISATRSSIGVSSAEIDLLNRRFKKLIESKRRQYNENPMRYPSIPELNNLFKGEYIVE